MELDIESAMSVLSIMFAATKRDSPVSCENYLELLVATHE